MKQPVLSRPVGWILLAGLVVLDAALDVLFAHGRGLESPVWKPLAGALGINNPLLLTPIVVIILFGVAKGLAFLVRKWDKIPTKAEELLVTILVLVYGVLDLWLLSVYLLGFTLLESRHLIPILIVIGVAYGWRAENKLKSKK